MVERAGAHSTDLQHPEEACDLCAKTKERCDEWAPVAARLWHDESDPQYKLRCNPDQGMAESDKHKFQRMGRVIDKMGEQTAEEQMREFATAVADVAATLAEEAESADEAAA